MIKALFGHVAAVSKEQNKRYADKLIDVSDTYSQLGREVPMTSDDCFRQCQFQDKVVSIYAGKWTSFVMI